MRRYLLATTALLTVAAPALAETISTKKTAPIQTSTVKAGAPDTISIDTAGSVELTGGNAVTQDSNHAVANAGKILVGNGNNANGGTGILSNAGISGDIANTGTIVVDEPYAMVDDDKDGDLDGPFAVGSGRYGIRTLGDHIGKIVNSGTITVEGNDSAGIALGGKLTGAFTHDGTTTVVGDSSVGVDARQIDGNVRLAGTVTAQGQGAVGARFGGDINGAMVVQGTVSSSGYRYPTAPADVSKLDANDLLQGGSALVIEGNVTGGVVLAVPPKADAAKPDSDGDGIEDAKEGSAKVTSYGSAAAMVVGATDRAIALGPVAGTASGFGLQIEGTVDGQGVYANVDANGLVVGGRGGAVSIANSIGVSGTVNAASNGANATALRIAGGASTPELRNSGTISASGASALGTRAQAVVVEAGGGLATLRNSGTIKATAGENGTAAAIVDRSGGLTLVENSGAISATGAKADSGRNVAIDLSANTSGVTVRQTVVASGTAPSIVGDVLLGGGNDKLELADGTLKGVVQFGVGNNALTLSGDAIQTGNVTFGNGNDALGLSGTSQYLGVADFGGGADALTLSGTSVFAGTLVGAANLNVTMTGGTLNVAKPAAIGSLTMGNGSVLVSTLDKAAGQGSAYTVAGTASFAAGSKLALRLADVSTAEGRYTVLTAGTLTGASNLTADSALVPYLFKAAIAADGGPNSIVVDVARRSVSELGLNRSQASAYSAVFTALAKDDKVEGVFLGITDGDTFREAVGNMLPDHAGGSFEGISLGVRSMARQMLDPRGPIANSGKLSVYANASFWGSNKRRGDSAAYSLTGYAWSLMAEYQTGVGAFSASASWLWNEHSRGAASNVKSNSYELAGGWRGSWGGLTAFGRASVGASDFDGKRTFAGAIGSETFSKTMRGDWKGSFVSFAGGISGEGGGSRFFYRPAVSIDYVRLKEKGYTEKDGGPALDLIVDSRASKEVGANAGLTLGLDFFGNEKDADNWMRLETEGGWREILSGGIGDTTARFKDGTAFTLAGEDATSGWFARLRMFGGSSGFTVGGELGAEERHDKVRLSLRGTMRIGF